MTLHTKCSSFPSLSPPPSPSSSFITDKKWLTTSSPMTDKKWLTISSSNVNFSHNQSAYRRGMKFKWFSKNSKDPESKDPQKRAIQYGKLLGLGVPVISKQMVKDKGWRKFCVLSWSSFYDAYEKMKPEDRVYYEVILDTAPCKFHIDVDMSLSSSSHSQEDARKIAQYRVQTLIIIIVDKMKQIYGDLGEIGNICVLDASKGDKFSQHIIFNLKHNNMFMDHSHVGVFLAFIYMLATREKKNWSDEINGSRVISNDNPLMLSDLFFLNEKKELQFIADLSIYGGNREFRILSSTKNGKNRWLNIISVCRENNGYYLDPFNNDQYPFPQPTMTKESFLNSLVSYIPKGEKIQHLLKCDWSVPYSRLPKCVMILKNPKRKRITRRKRKRREIDENISSANAFIDDLQQYGLSLSSGAEDDDVDDKTRNLFDRIGENIEENENMVERGDTVEYNDNYFDEDSYCLIYRSTSKWCEIKYDEHTSNHVFYVVWLESKIYYQKCFDEECMAKEQRYLTESLHKSSNGHAEEDDDTLFNIDSGDDERGETNDNADENTGGGREGKSYCRGVSKRIDEELWEEINEFLKKEKTVDVNDNNGMSIDKYFQKNESENDNIGGIHKKRRISPESINEEHTLNNDNTTITTQLTGEDLINTLFDD